MDVFGGAEQKHQLFERAVCPHQISSEVHVSFPKLFRNSLIRLKTSDHVWLYLNFADSIASATWVYHNPPNGQGHRKSDQRRVYHGVAGLRIRGWNAQRLGAALG